MVDAPGDAAATRHDKYDQLIASAQKQAAVKVAVVRSAYRKTSLERVVVVNVDDGSDPTLAIRSGSITPIVLSQPGIPSVDPARTAVALINSLSQDDFAGNGAVQISAGGRIEQPAG